MCQRLLQLQRNRDWRHWLALLLLLAGLQQLAAAALIKAKAWLAPVLIEQAWDATLQQAGAPVKPWPWADTWPVARLQVGSADVDLLVLAGDTGNALAFGPGHSRAFAPLGSAGPAVIGGHRDTHFAFLQQARRGMHITLQLADGSWRDYRVVHIAIADTRTDPLPVDAGRDMLLLVTCYPFDALSANGPLRYVVAALPVTAGDAAVNRM